MSGRTFRDFLSDWKWILSYTKQYKVYVVTYTFLGVLSSTLGLLAAYVTGVLINVISKRQTDRLALSIGLTIGITLLAILCNALRDRLSAKIELDLVKDIQADLFMNIIDLQWSELRKYKNGDILNRFNKDMAEIMNGAITWIPNILINIYTFIITFALLLSMDFVMALIALCSAPFVFILSRVILSKQKEHRQRVLQLDSDMMSFEAESFYNMDTVKAFGVWDVLSDRFASLQSKYRLYNMDYRKFQIKTNTALSLLGYGVYFVALGYCLFRLWSGDILFGDMTFFMTQRSSLSSIFNSLISTIPVMMNASISAHRIKEFIGLSKEEHNTEAYEAIKATSDKGLSVEVQNITFSYDDSNGEKVYENTSFSVSPGEVVAFLGESGGGKTTLFRLLLGLVIPNEGHVVLKDGEGREIDINADLRKFISYVPQGNTMMLGTIADNMRIVKKDATDDEIIDALKTACAWEFVESIGGINFMLGERGKRISEGQAQRISIARALLRNAPILFLDEATSALDEETETRVLENVVKSSPKKTIIISTHRPSVLKRCHRIYRITNQRVEIVNEETIS